MDDLPFQQIDIAVAVCFQNHLPLHLPLDQYDSAESGLPCRLVRKASRVKAFAS
jgi:hypothetical protein